MWLPFKDHHTLEDQAELEASSLFRRLAPKERYAVLDLLEVAKLDAGRSVAEALGEADGPIIVLSGELGAGRPPNERVLGPGAVIGEDSLGCASARPAAELRAHTDLRLARLRKARFKALEGRSPQMALAISRALSQRDERAAPPSSSLTVRARVPVETERGLVVGARAGGRTLALHAPLPPEIELEPLTIDDWEGREIYKRSAGLVVLEAARRAGYPGLRLGPSWSSGRLVVAPECGALPDEAIARINHQIEALTAERAELREEVWSTDDAARYLRERALTDVADLVASSTEPHVELVSCGDLRLPSPGPVLPDAGMLVDIRVFPHPDGLALDFGAAVRRTLAPRPAKTLMLEALAPRYGADMTKEEQGWRRILEVSSVGSFNRAVITGEVAEVIRVSEGFHEKRLGRLADEIRDRGSVRIVAVAGPSSSGKTTFIKRLRIQLEVNGIRPVGLSLDDYYVDRERTARDASGALDYEALEALDRELLARHLGALLSGQRVRTARYDFISGKSDPAGGSELDLNQDKVLILEGLHALNPDLVPGLDPRTVHRIFIHPASALAFDPLTSFEPADVRLLRRIVRDRHGRGASAETNLARWASVRRGERLAVFPFQASADGVFDTSLLYEVSVLKVFAERYLLEVPRSSPQFPAALRLRKLIAPFVPIYPDHVPPTSILREFIGGGGFTW